MNRRDLLKLAAALAGASGSSRASFAQEPAPRPASDADGVGRGQDLALINATILTLEPNRPEVSAALVRRGRIVALGEDREVRAQAGAARVFDAGGRVVVPGFIDAHTHFEYTCLWRAFQVDCHTPPVASIPELLDALRARARTTPPGRWVIGRASWLPYPLAEKRMPTRAEMDSVSQEHPVILLSSMHVGVLNTRGMKETGLWDAAEVAKMTWPGGKPRVGTFVERDASGEPGSVATEMWELLAPYPIDEIEAAIRSHARSQFVEKGLTSVSTMPFTANELRASQRLHAAGELPLRLRVYYNLPQCMSVEAVVGAGLEPGFGDDGLRFGGVKIFVTGIWTDGLGHRLEDYKWTADELDAAVGALHDAGVQVCLHTIGDAGPIERALRAVERAQARNPKPIRHRLEHVEQLEDLEHVRRLVKLGMRVTLTRAQRSSGAAAGGPPFRTFVREGLEPIAISDTTGTTPAFSPLQGIAALVAPAGEGGGARAGESVTFDDALRMWTLWAARGNQEERDKGSIAVGKLGDFVVLSRDPRALPAPELFEVEVDATVLGGEVVFERGQRSAALR